MSRLFIVSVASGYGGAERSIEIIARHLPEELETSIYAAHPEHLANLEAVAHTRRNLRISRLSATPRFLPRQIAARTLLTEFRRDAPDAVLINTNASALLCSMVARREPRMAERSALYVRDFQWQDLDYIFSRLPHSRVFVPNEVVGERTGYLFPFHIGPNGRAFTVVPDMVELPVPSPAAAAEAAGPFLHLATVNPFKGHAELMLATLQLKTGGAPVSVRSAGHPADPNLYRHLVALRDRLGLRDEFEFVGYVRSPDALLEQCCAVVIPSVSHSGGPETFGRSVIEAWSRSKPVIAYATGAPARLISHEQDGLLVPEGDTAGLAEAMRRLWGDPQLRQRLGEAGYRKAAANFEAKVVTRQLVATLGL